MNQGGAGSLSPGPEQAAPPLLEEWLFPCLRALVRSGYFSLRVDNAGLVPRSGRVVYVANHAGWVTFDSMMAALALRDHVGGDRLPCAIAQDVLFRIPLFAQLLHATGAVPVSRFGELLSGPGPKDAAYAMYPEGAEGSCKPFWRAYRMAPWRPGFVRLALAQRALVVPIAILGGEECMPSAWAVRSARRLIGAVAPVPLTMLPLPTAWRIIFHPPVDLSTLAAPADEAGRGRALAAQVRGIVQRTLDSEAAARPLRRLAALLSFG